MLDVDVAVLSDPELLARTLEQDGLGRCVRLSEAAPRVYRVAGRRDLDLALLEGETLEQDLARRDFTVNAVAVELPGGRWCDPFGGMADLARRRLRPPRRGNFAADPVRVFRAARFLATHELQADRAASREAAASAPGLAQVAPERIRIELARLLEAPCAAPALAWAARIGALGPALGVSQSSVRRLRRRLAALDTPAVRRQEADSRRRLRLALLADGLGFSSASAAGWLLSRRFSREEAARTARLLELVERARSAGPGLALWDWIRDAGELAPAALALWRARRPDERGRIGGLARRWKSARRTPAIRGADVVAWAGIPAGPHVGELLREVEREILRGAIRTRGEARRWVSERVLRG